MSVSDLSCRADSVGPDFGDALLEWGRLELRDLPWRRTRDPWAILVAETMLQQTQVTRVVDRWAGFLARFADPATCAAAPAAEVVREWAGLGYNRRAVMLHRAAERIVHTHGGRVPSSLDALLDLPGVGPYTARAVRAFAFELPAAPLDTNIGRVLARIGGTRLAAADAQRRADALAAGRDVWIWNQSLMELGALVCTKRSPVCDRCPVAEGCAWRGDGPDPADGSAAVGRPQGRFAGSDRQLRGRLVAALRSGPVALPAAESLLADADPRARERVFGGLVADGLIESDGAVLALAGDLSSAR